MVSHVVTVAISSIALASTLCAQPHGGTRSCVEITGSPQPYSPCLLDTALFIASGSSTETISYQWRRQGAPLVDGETGWGSIISGVNDSTLTIFNSVHADEGDYDCVLTADCGSATTDAASLTIATPPSIIDGPDPTTACVGSTTTLSVTAVGTEVSFEWNHGDETLIDGPTGNGSVISGSSTPVLTIIGVSAGDAGDYFCGVFSVCGSDVSPAATLEVTQCPTCPGDLDGDGDVDIADLARLLAHFGDSEAQPGDGDIDVDGDVDLSDLAQLLGRFGSVC